MNAIQYIGRDNITKLLLKSDGSPVNLSQVVKIDLIIGKTTISNTTGNSFPIKWIDTDTTGEIQIQLEDESISLGTYMAQIIIYDSTLYPDGFVWGNFTLEIREV